MRYTQPRKIIHIDMDAFFASIEQRDHPDWCGRALAVGGRAERRGVIAAASYEARQFGVHSAMPTRQALQLCPELLIVPHRMSVYRAVSQRIRRIFRRYTDLVEPLSLDEAYLDVSLCSQHEGLASEIARAIKAQIWASEELTASAGVSYNKFLAKVASDQDKPNGLYVIPPERGPQFVARLPVGQFHGVGKVTAAKMHGLGIYTGADLRRWPLSALQASFGQSAQFLYQIARGQDHRKVTPLRQRKSIGAETTFAQDVFDREAQLSALRGLAQEVVQSMQKYEVSATTLNIKVRYPDFSTVTRQHSLGEGEVFQALAEMQPWLATLLERTEAERQGVRLLGVSVSGLRGESEQDPQQLPLL